MRFYHPDKTFLELIQGYQGDLDEAYCLFEDAWELSFIANKEERTLAEAFGSSPQEHHDYSCDKISILTLLQKGKAAKIKS